MPTGADVAAETRGHRAIHPIMRLCFSAPPWRCRFRLHEAGTVQGHEHPNVLRAPCTVPFRASEQQLAAETLRHRAIHPDDASLCRCASVALSVPVGVNL